MDIILWLYPVVQLICIVGFASIVVATIIGIAIILLGRML